MPVFYPEPGAASSLNAQANSMPDSRLLQEVRALRDTVGTLLAMMGAPYQVTLRAVQPRPYLGQPVTIVAMVVDVEGSTPAADIPVTFVAAWGRLRAADGYTVQQGSSVTARTGVDGQVRVTLLPPTGEDLWDVQQEAMGTMLAYLDPEAESPQQTEAGLQEMARQYRWEANIEFRRAVDIYFEYFGRELLDTVNYRDYMQAWDYVDSAVIAYARNGSPEGESGTAVHSTAALTLRFKDWLGPWLETYLRLSESEGTLEGGFEHEKQLNPEADALVDGIYGRVRDYVERQRGVVGKFVGERVAGTSIRKFLESGIGDLPLDTKLRLYPALGTAIAAVTGRGAGGLASLSQVRGSLRQELTAQIDQAYVDLLGKADGAIAETLPGKVDGAIEAALPGRLDTAIGAALPARIDALLNDRLAPALEAFRTEVDAALETQIGQFRTEVDTALKGKIGQAELDAFSQRMGEQWDTQFGQFRTEMNTALETKIGQAELDASSQRMSKQWDTQFGQLRTEVNAALKGKIGQAELDAFSQRMGQQWDTQFEQFRTEVNTALKGKIGQAELDAFSQQMGAQWRAQFEQFQGDIKSTLETKIGQAELDAFSRWVTQQWDTQFGQFRTEVNTALKGKIGQAELDAFSQRVTQQWDTQFGQFRTEVNTALEGKADRTSLSTLSRQVSDMNRQLKGSAAQLERTFSTMGDLLTVLDENFVSRDRRFTELRERFRNTG
jgi:hypothetical protein